MDSFDLFLSKIKNSLPQKKNEQVQQTQTQIQTQTQHKCQLCGKDDKIIIDSRTANKICSECGCVVTKVLDHEAEWRYYGLTADDYQHASDPTRCGLPVDELLPKSSLNTKIKYTGTRYLSLVRLHKWNLIHPEERSLFTVFKYMDKILINLSVPKIAKIQAKEYYKLLSAKDDRKGTLTRGVIRKSFIAACIFVSCKNNHTPIQKGKIASICGISKFDITKGFKKFSTLEKNKNVQLNKPNRRNMHNLIHRFASQLNFTKTMEDIAHILITRLPKLKLLQDTNDISINAGMLYYVSVLFYDTTTYRPKILSIINTSVVTLEKIYKVIKRHETYLLIGLHSFIPRKIQKPVPCDKSQSSLNSFLIIWNETS